MKLFSKIAVIAAAFMLVSVFASCKTEEEGPATVAEFESKEGKTVATVTFYDDDSFEFNGTEEIYGTLMEFYISGTYKGDVTKKNVEGTYEITEATYNGADYPIPSNQAEGEFEIVDDVLYFMFFSAKRK